MGEGQRILADGVYIPYTLNTVFYFCCHGGNNEWHEKGKMRNSLMRISGAREG